MGSAKIGIEVIENSEQAMKDYGFLWGCSVHEITKQQLAEFASGKVLAMNDGEYSTFVKIKESD